MMRLLELFPQVTRHPFIGIYLSVCLLRRISVDFQLSLVFQEFAVLCYVCVFLFLHVHLLC